MKHTPEYILQVLENMDRDAVYCKYCGAKMKEGSENHE